MICRIALPLIFLASAVAAQAPSRKSSGFDVGRNVVGAVVGFGSLGSASVSVGARFEHPIKTLPDLGNGTLGFGLDADFYRYNEPVVSGVSYTFIPIGASLNYHFRLDDRRWDPFLGLGLGHSIGSVTGGGSRYTASSSLYVISRAGIRYFYSPTMGFQADAGVGAAAVNVGVVWKM